MYEGMEGRQYSWSMVSEGRSDTRWGWKNRQRVNIYPNCWLSTSISNSAFPLPPQPIPPNFSFSTKVFHICPISRTLNMRIFLDYPFRIIWNVPFLVLSFSFLLILCFLSIWSLYIYMVITLWKSSLPPGSSSFTGILIPCLPGTWWDYSPCFLEDRHGHGICFGK